MKKPHFLKALFVVASAMLFVSPVFAQSKFNPEVDPSLPLAVDYSELCAGDLNLVHYYGSNQPQDSETLKVFVWNTKKFENSNAFIDLNTFAKDADIVFLQEAAHSNHFQLSLIEKLPNHRHMFFPSFCDDSAFAYGVQLATRLNSSYEQRWPSPDTEPFSTIHKMSSYSLVEWNGQKIHVINTHALNFNPGGKFKEQIYDLYQKISKLEGPVIWAGDFNTWVPMRRKYLFELATELGLTHVVPDNDNRKLKLDHVFYRGISLESATIVELRTSDHFAISLEFKQSVKQDHKSLGAVTSESGDD